MRTLTPTQSDLAARYVPMARWLARVKGRRRAGWARRRADLVGTAFVALCTSARDYRKPSPIPFTSFARWRIIGEVGKVLADDPPMSPPDDNDRPDPHDNLAGFEAIDAAEALLRKLPSIHAQVLRLVVLDGLTQTEAGRQLGLSQNEIARLIRQSRTLMGA